ncbi:protein FEZ-like [Forsythia ovata]|uniref:Protein FEZ-like n=1 Tax=Forsythia ovata TaxID=205694 RepID=A0ABD1WRU8_9LAMI
MAQRAISQSWVASLSETSDAFTEGAHYSQFIPANISPISETQSTIQLCSSNESRQPSPANFSAIDILLHKQMDAMTSKESIFTTSNGDFPGNFMFSPPEEATGSTKCTLEVPSMLFNISPASISNIDKTTECIELEGPQQEMQGSISVEDDEGALRNNQCSAHIPNQWQSIRQIGFPFSLPSTVSDSSNLNFPWDSPPCPSEISTTHSTNKFYT